MSIHFKALRKGRYTTHAGSRWPKSGIWLEVEGELVPCHNGLHVASLPQLLEFWLHERVWLVEVDDEAGTVQCDDKMVARRARLVRKLPWDGRVARLFAADCAERVLPVFEREVPGDDRPRLAIEVARRSAGGDATDEELAAAGAAAGDAAWAAARAAEREWQVARLAEILGVEVQP